MADNDRTKNPTDEQPAERGAKPMPDRGGVAFGLGSGGPTAGEIDLTEEEKRIFEEADRRAAEYDKKYPDTGKRLTDEELAARGSKKLDLDGVIFGVGRGKPPKK